MNPELLIEQCVTEALKNNCIRHLKTRDNWPLGESESLLELKSGRLSLRSHHPKQDEWRLRFALSLITEALAGTVVDFDCQMILSLADAVSEDEVYTRLVFATNGNTNHLPIPDPHIFRQIKGIDELLLSDIHFDKKRDEVVFYGSDTGKIMPDLLNQRVKFCHDARNHPSVRAKISNFVHFSSAMLADLGVQMSDISSELVPPSKQLESKYILDIDGNACSWDRTPWVMASNSYYIHLESDACKNFSWYHPFVRKHGIAPNFSKDAILGRTFQFNPVIKEGQKKFANIILNPMTHLNYMRFLLTAYNEIYNAQG